MANPFNNNPSPINTYNMDNIRNMYQTLINSNNPMQVFENLASRNPNMKPILSALKNGVNPKSLFESMCKERGINPDDFIKSIQGKS